MAGGDAAIIFAIVVIVNMEVWGLLYNRPRTLKHALITLLSWPFQLPSVVRRWWR